MTGSLVIDNICRKTLQPGFWQKQQYNQKDVINNVIIDRPFEPNSVEVLYTLQNAKKCRHRDEKTSFKKIICFQIDRIE